MPRTLPDSLPARRVPRSKRASGGLRPLPRTHRQSPVPVGSQLLLDSPSFALPEMARDSAFPYSGAGSMSRSSKLWWPDEADSYIEVTLRMLLLGFARTEIGRDLVLDALSVVG